MTRFLNVVYSNINFKSIDLVIQLFNTMNEFTAVCICEWVIVNLLITYLVLYMWFTSCHVCGSQYVGESVQPFNKRKNGHRSDLTKKTLLPVSQHFVSPGHSLEDFGRSKIYIFDTTLILNIIYVWKLNQAVLELDPRAVKLLFS